MFWTDGQFVLGKQGCPETYMPLYFRHNSLIVMGHIRRAHVSQADAESQGQPKESARTVKASHSPSEERGSVTHDMRVRMVARPGAVLKRILRDASYFKELIEGVWGIQLLSASFINVHEALPREGLQYRSTLVQQDDGSWRLLEISENLDQLANPSEPIPGIVQPCIVICLAHREVRLPRELGFEVDGDAAASATTDVPRAPADPSQELPELGDDGSGAEVEGQPSRVGDVEMQQHRDDPERQAALEASRSAWMPVVSFQMSLKSRVLRRVPMTP